MPHLIRPTTYLETLQGLGDVCAQRRVPSTLHRQSVESLPRKHIGIIDGSLRQNGVHGRLAEFDERIYGEASLWSTGGIRAAHA